MTQGVDAVHAFMGPAGRDFRLIPAQQFHRGLNTKVNLMAYVQVQLHVHFEGVDGLGYCIPSKCSCLSLLKSELIFPDHRCHTGHDRTSLRMQPTNHRYWVQEKTQGPLTDLYRLKLGQGHLPLLGVRIVFWKPRAMTPASVSIFLRKPTS